VPEKLCILEHNLAVFASIHNTQCTSVCLPTTQDQLQQLPVDSQGSSGESQNGREPENWHFSYGAAPAGEAWAALGSRSLLPWTAAYCLGQQ